MRKWQEAGWLPPESTCGERILPLPPRCSDRPRPCPDKLRLQIATAPHPPDAACKNDR